MLLEKSGSVDLRSLRLLNLCKCLGSHFDWLNTEYGTMHSPRGTFPQNRYREGKNPFYSLLFIKRGHLG